MSALSRTTSAIQDEKVELAVDEGHDADIPSNVGFVNDKENESRAAAGAVPPNNVDIEREAATRSPSTSRSFSTKHSREQIEQQPNEQEDPFVVWWDSPSDPQNPMNCSRFWHHISVAPRLICHRSRRAAANGGVWLIGTRIWSLPTRKTDTNCKTKSELLSGFVVSVYVLGFAIGPLSMNRFRLWHAYS
jgi:hypothetical protein